MKSIFKCFAVASVLAMTILNSAKAKASDLWPVLTQINDNEVYAEINVSGGAYDVSNNGLKLISGSLAELPGKILDLGRVQVDAQARATEAIKGYCKDKSSDTKIYLQIYSQIAVRSSTQQSYLPVGIVKSEKYCGDYVPQPQPITYYNPRSRDGLYLFSDAAKAFCVSKGHKYAIDFAVTAPKVGLTGCWSLDTSNGICTGGLYSYSQSASSFPAGVSHIYKLACAP